MYKGDPMKNIRQSSLDFIREYKHRSYFLRNFALILLLILIPLTLIVTLYYNNSRKTIYDDIKQTNKDLLLNVTNMSTYVLKNALNIGFSLSLQDSIKTYCYNGTIQDFHSSGETLFDTLETLELTNESIHSIEVYSKEKDCLLSDSGFISNTSSVYHHSVIQQSLKEYLATPTFFHSLRYNIYPHLITVYVPVLSGIKRQTIIGAIIINVNFEYLDQLLNLPDNIKFYILKNDDTVLYVNEIDDTKELPTSLDVISKLKQSGESQLIDGSSLYSYTKGTVLGDAYLTVTSLDNYQERFSKMPLLLFLYIGIAFILSIVYAILIVNHTSKPITALLNIFSANSELKNYKSEDEFLTCKIVDAVDKNESLQTLLSQRMQLLHNTQLIALQTQINPHFLYNTLETIKWNAMDLTNGENEVSTTIQDLGQLLRYSLTMTPRYVPFITEKEYLNLYLKIINIRFKDPILIQWDYADAINNCKIPRLFLQPIIENSIQHGLRSISGQKLITIKAFFSDSFLYIKVIDNGVGMSSAEIDSLNKYLTDSEQIAEKHIGLLNLVQRIQICYGSDCYLKVASEQNIGTTVSIRIHVIQ